MKFPKINRRKFINSCATATLGAMASPWLTGCQSRPRIGKSPSDKLQVGCIGMGNQMHSLLREFTSYGQNIMAICDVDENRIAATHSAFGDAVAKANTYSDYRKFFEREKSLDAVIIATPDHWHAAVCKAAMHAGKHIYCEKPLAHTVAEARYIGTMAKRSKVVTQTGNQGSGSANFRRSIELIQGGVLGSVREIHIWHPPHGWPCGMDRPAGADAVPAGFDWNFWIGPAPMRPYKTGLYHPVNWRGWYDFGGGSLSDFCCHAFSMPVRALKLDYPNRIEVTGVGLGLDSFPKSCRVHFLFPARDGRDAVSIYFHTGGDLPDPAITAGLADSVPRTGCILVGDKGSLSAGLWNNECLLKMKGETDFESAAVHDAAKHVPESLPRAPQERHMLEWIEACKGKGKTFSPFEIGGHVTEIGAAGLIPLRLGRDIDWDGRVMKAAGVSQTAARVKPQHRDGWGL